MNIIFEIARIPDFVFEATLKVLPLFLGSVAIAALINQLNLTQKLTDFFRKNLFYAFSLATVIGAISPLCSCGVIPTIYAFINVGIPLVPIMSFWITSPTMSHEAFMITWGYIGLKLAIVRLIATIIMGLTAGFITLKIFPLDIPSQNWLKSEVEKEKNNNECERGCNSDSELKNKVEPEKTNSIITFLKDVKKHVIFLGGWLIAAFILKALISFYFPQELIIGLFGKNNAFSIPWAAIIGIPLYFNNISAVPIVGGLMQVGMGKGAALAFLLAGPITAIPAMVAVLGIVKKKVFMVFLVISFTLSVACGYLYQIISQLTKKNLTQYL